MDSVSGRVPDFREARGKHVLVALSGGADSVALTVMLAARREALSIRLSAAHMDHGIRLESATDADFCRALCHRLEIPFHTVRVDVPAEASRMGLGLETAARRIRHDWLNRLRSEIGADMIALAHHMDDQAETVLMHLARGAGPKGIGGMRERSGVLYRPLLGFRKDELKAFLAQNGFDWREDTTNALADNPRNALRLHVIPELEKSYPQFVRAAARYAQSAQIESDFVDEAARAWLDDRTLATPFFRRIACVDLPHRAVLRRALQIFFPESLSCERLNGLEALCADARGRLDLGTEWLAERTGRYIYFIPKRPPSVEPVPLTLSGTTRLDGLGEIRAKPCEPIPVRDDPLRQALDAGALLGAEVRTRRDGDRFRPLGCGDKLLSDFLTDRKIDRPLRDCVMLVAKGSRVLWACGLGVSEDAKLTSDTRKAVLLDCRPDFNVL